MKIFGMGGFELVIILVVILLIFGPKNLPKLGNALGKTVSNLRSGMNEGKKKAEDDEASEVVTAAEEDAQEKPAVAEIEGVVEAPVEEEAVERAEPADFDAEAAVDEVFESKKVRRVVKKKVSVEDVQ